MSILILSLAVNIGLLVVCAIKKIKNCRGYGTIQSYNTCKILFDYTTGPDMILHNISQFHFM